MKLSICNMARGLIAAFRPWSREFGALVHELRAISIPPLSVHLGDSLVEGEDHRFRTHCGVDLWAVARAMVKTVVISKREGASTIQQQLVRVATGRYEITLRRKIREMAFAVALGSCFKRAEMLALYLIKGYYGYRMSGLFQACTRLRISPTTANPVEAANLVARLRYPEPRSKSWDQQTRIERRAQHILTRLALAKRRDLTKATSPRLANFPPVRP